MADSTLDSEKFYLIDLFPGAPIPSFTAQLPSGGFTGSESHNVASAAYPLGTKIQVQNRSASAGVDGFSIFMYGQVGTQNPDVSIGAKSVCTLDSASDPYELTNDSDTDIATTSCPAAVALSAMTNGNYGWFWVGGVCPEEHVSGLAGNYDTEGNVVAGGIVVAALAASNVPLGFGPLIDEGDGGGDVTPGPVACGFALGADA